MPFINMTSGNAIESVGSGFGGTVVFTVTLSEPAADQTTVAYRTIAVSSTDALDFRPQNGVLTFAPGERIKTIEFRVQHDNLEEIDESLAIELFNPVGAEFEGNQIVLRQDAFILDDDGAALDRAVSVSSPVLVEGDGGASRARFDVRLSEPSVSTIELSYATRDGSARAGEDYVAQTGTLAFFAGETEKSVFVDLRPDDRSEASEFFHLALSPHQDLGTTGAGLVGTATLLDDDGDGRPVISVEAVNAPESIGSGFGGMVTFALSLSEPAADAVSVQYKSLARSGTEDIDYPDFAGELVFAAGEQRKLVDIRVRHDNDIETDESFGIELFDPVGATLEGGAKVLRENTFIIDDDGVNLGRALVVSSPVIVEGDSAPRSAWFDVLLSQPSSEELVFDYATVDGSATAGDDYVSTSGQLRFAPGQTRASVEVRLTGDGTVEPSEFFHLALSRASGLGQSVAGLVGTARLLDDDGGDRQPVLSLEGADAIESIGSGFGGVVRFTLTLSEPAVDSVTVSYRTSSGSATQDIDFPTVANVVTFAPGETSKEIQIRARHDNDIESDESLSFELFDLDGAIFAGGADRLIGAAFIQDDDGVNLDRAIHVTDVVAVEPGGAKGFAVFELRLSEAFDTVTTLSYRTVDGSAQAGRDYVATAGQVRLLPGQMSAAVNVELLSDLSVETVETFSLLLQEQSLPANLNLAGSVLRGQAELVDDDHRGSGGNDVLRGSRADEGLSGFGGNDRLLGRGGNDRIDGGGGNDRLVGGSGDDTLLGRGGADALKGGSGDDRMIGGTGRDKLIGGNGDDMLSGGKGGDVLRGNGGADTFVFGTGDAGIGRRRQDTIRDLDRAEGDAIDLSAIDGNRRAGGQQELVWIGRDADFTQAGQVRFDTDRSRLEINTDRDRAAEIRIVLNGVDDFGARDLIL
ncbi:hemolysin type calcium-binding protein [Limimaricola soesokkakensis]|uniref:Hemolysin type calcium-binding protein n=2 Tax=Limimaricola soesokkakensis TaxID=1343159 RepID=A0A1X7A0L8_9RHOB|nr:hemolysin type calcium-binding protein [Limimaricola soesokkakensis]SLN67233.1 Hemolysin, plasmid [Limimaricola soesokkakensis]